MLGFALQLALPLADLVGMDPLVAGPFIERFQPFERFQRHLGFEFGRMIFSTHGYLH